jgi:hypothetical protein
VVSGQITTDSGGTATAEVVALCLKYVRADSPIGLSIAHPGRESTPEPPRSPQRETVAEALV